MTTPTNDASRFPRLSAALVAAKLPSMIRLGLLAAAAADLDTPMPQGQAPGAHDDDVAQGHPATQASWARAFGTGGDAA